MVVFAAGVAGEQLQRPPGSDVRQPLDIRCATLLRPRELPNLIVFGLLECAHCLLCCKRFSHKPARVENPPNTVESWSLAMNKR
jgi:hypothetical protein